MTRLDELEAARLSQNEYLVWLGVALLTLLLAVGVLFVPLQERPTPATDQARCVQQTQAIIDELQQIGGNAAAYCAQITGCRVSKPECDDED